MNLERLDRSDRRLIWICLVLSVLSLFVGIKYYFLAFPEASIEFRVTKESSLPTATSFLASLGLDAAGYRHASIFEFDDRQKTFLERELGVAESNRLLETTVRLWRWKHRWYRPLQKEEMNVEVTTKGEVVGFARLLPEEAEGAALAVEEARSTAERFLTQTMQRPLDTLSFVEGATQKRPKRTDHSFTWKVLESDVKGADYRVEVSVAGDRVAGYREYLKVPDAWSRGYAELRSRNEIAGQIDAVFLLLTILAMLVFLVLRVRRGDVRWKAAAILGGLICVLLSVSELNSLPSVLYRYDTTTSFGGFLLGQILGALGVGLGGGAVIFFLTASAEPFYRERWPKLLSLSSFLRVRALRTKEFFISTLVGMTLTFFFFAYENVFYLIANALGAWSPRDVPYSDLLSTAFPWVYVLFFGFLPAISEEFISRMFSIPFFERVFRSTTVAILLSSLIWGFGHAGYPNQPFWIRGLEVGLAGVVFGLVMLRWGIASVVICHFSVDALYTAFVLMRSDNLYYRISGGLSSGIFVVLLLIAALLYLRRGGFTPAEVTNEVEGVSPAPLSGLVEALPTAAARAATAAYVPLGGRRVACALALAAGIAAVRLIPIERFGDWARYATTPAEACGKSAAFLQEQGFDVSGYRSAVVPFDRIDPTVAAYLKRKGGQDLASRFYRDLAPTPLWRVRFFVPGQKEEHAVSVETTTGRALGFERILAEDAAGASLAPDQALDLARTFLSRSGIDPAGGELKEQTAKEEKARRDHTLVWEFAAPSAGEARVRHQIVVQGDAVGSWELEVKIPEEWRRERERSTAPTVILQWLKLPLFVILGGFALFVLIVKIRAGEIPWKFALTVGGVVSIAALVRSALSLDAVWFRYSTAIPAGGFLVLIAVGLLLGALAWAVAATILAALSGALHPPAVTALVARERPQYARDALVTGIAGLGVAVGVPAISRILGAVWPGGPLLGQIAQPDGVDARLPFLSLVAGSIQTTVLLAGTGAIVAGLLIRHFRPTWARGALAVLAVLSFLPGGAREAVEYGLASLSLALSGAAVVGLVVLVARNNPLAWMWTAYFVPATLDAARLLAQPSTRYRWNGAVALAAVVLPALWLVRDAKGWRRNSAGGTRTGVQV